MAARLAAGRHDKTTTDKATTDRAAALIDHGRQFARQGAISKLIRADMDFHRTIYDLSGNRMIREMLQPAWYHFGRTMGEVLAQEEAPREIWEEHEAILDAIMREDPETAEARAREHVSAVSEVFMGGLRRRGGREAKVG